MNDDAMEMVVVMVGFLLFIGFLVWSGSNRPLLRPTRPKTESGPTTQEKAQDRMDQLFPIPPDDEEDYRP